MQRIHFWIKNVYRVVCFIDLESTEMMSRLNIEHKTFGIHEHIKHFLLTSV